MGTFDIKTESPGALRTESLNTSLKFERTGPNTGRVSWNIPTPAAGCGSDDQAYCGIVITLDNTATNISKSPVDEIIYSSDPTADTNLFAGDKIGTALVVGAYYGNRTTTFFDITGLTPNTPYYVSGFPVDCQNRYYREGIHAYSLNFTSNHGTDPTYGTQIAVINASQNPPGVQPTDFTGLVPGINYNFGIQLGVIPSPKNPVDPLYCNPAPLTYDIVINGADAVTYDDLIKAINKQLSLLYNSPQSPTPPNTGTFIWINNKLYIWNGTNAVEQPTIIQSTAPNLVNIGTYWVNPTNNTLKVWNGATWTNITVYTSTIDPLLPVANISYWYDGTYAYEWNGTAWCRLETIIKNTDPSVSVPSLLGSFWYNQLDSVLYAWDASFGMWKTTQAIQHTQNPNLLDLNTLWFDQSTNQLKEWINPTWAILSNLSISERRPSIPALNRYWYNPTSNILEQWDGTNWNVLPLITFPFDPTIRNFCDLWWNTITNEMNIWDGVNSVWKQASSFYIQFTDPSVPLIPINGSAWYNNITHQLYIWVNNCYKLVNVLDTPNDPTTLPPGVAWYNPTTNTWKILNVSLDWVDITYISSVNDPNNLPSGTYWFNDISNQLSVWNGVNWISIAYTTSDLTPPENTMWFDTSINTLMIWKDGKWVKATPKATVELDCHGNLLFTDSTPGSVSFVALTAGTLFSSLSNVIFHDPKPGTDGISDKPSYEELGIGTNGSMAQRLQMMDEIRYELGYPSIPVELSQEQMDYAITRALNELRQKSGLGYKRGFFFMQTQANVQRYLLTNKVGGFNKIVDVLGIQRVNHQSMGSQVGMGAFGQMVLQQFLYNMGNFDLLSYHLIAEYSKTMEILFSTRLTYTWNEQTRELWIHHKFPYNEPFVSVECSVERSEQDLMTDRYARPWLRRYTAAVCRLMLSEIRGKFSTLPGANGGITLNADALRMAAKEEMDACLAEIDDYIADRPEEYGMWSTMCFG